MIQMEKVAPAPDTDCFVVPTTRFGDITVERDKVITMVMPFFGFPASRSFVLRPHAEDSPFMWLQSLDEPQLAFVVMQPGVFLADYSPQIPDGVVAELELQHGGQQEILIVLTIPQGRPEEMTANLLGPVVINVTKRLAKQVLLDPRLYDPCWPVLKC